MRRATAACSKAFYANIKPRSGVSVRAQRGCSRRLVFHLSPDELLKPIVAAATVPVVNARSDQHNPCQALTDALPAHS